MKMNLLMMQTVPIGNLLIASMSFTNNCRLRNIERLSPVNLSKLQRMYIVLIPHN